MHGVLQGKAKAVQKLIALGADLTVPEKDGYTPMHGAGFQGRAKVAKLLAAAGVDVNDVHADGYAPIHRACWGTQQRHAETVEAMLALGATLADRAACGRAPASKRRPPGNGALRPADVMGVAPSSHRSRLIAGPVLAAGVRRRSAG